MSKAVLSRDTTLEVERIQVGIWRPMSPLEKGKLISAVTLSARKLAMVGLRGRHPRVSPRELTLRMAELTLGTELSRRAYPDATELLGSRPRHRIRSRSH